MSTHLSRFFRQRREAQEALVRRNRPSLGYTNVAKGANKVIKFERDGTSGPSFSVSWLRSSKSPTTTFAAASRRTRPSGRRGPTSPSSLIWSPDHVRRLSARNGFLPSFRRPKRRWTVRFGVCEGEEVAGLARVVEGTRVWFDEQGQRTGVSEAHLRRILGRTCRWVRRISCLGC